MEGEPQAVEKQHSEKKLTARERIAKLVDPRTFIEEFRLAESPCIEFGMAEMRAPTDGVVTGFG